MSASLQIATVQLQLLTLKLQVINRGVDHKDYKTDMATIDELLSRTEKLKKLL